MRSSILVFIAAVCLVTCGVAQDEPSLRVIDAHTHVDFDGQVVDGRDGVRDTREQYLKEWKDAGVVAAVAHENRHQTDKPKPDLPITYCAGIPEQPDPSRVEKGLQSHKYGCIKIYLGYVRRWAYDPAYEPIYKLAEKYDVPVVFHTGDTSSRDALVKYSDPLAIDEVAVTHRKVNFVIAHCGNPWIESAAEVAYKNPNVYIECSALMIGDLRKVPPEKMDTYVVKPIQWIFGYIEDPKKMMFGTDWPLAEIKPYLDAYKRAIPREYWQAVFHDNAAKVFHMKDEIGK